MTTLTTTAVVVTPHAVDSARRRLLDDRPAEVVAREIEDEVSLSIAAGRMSPRKKRAFLLHHERARNLGLGYRFCWSSDGRRGWILAVGTQPDTWVVVTAMVRVDEKGRAAV